MIIDLLHQEQGLHAAAMLDWIEQRNSFLSNYESFTLF